jgi:hypothetical protein
MPEAARRIEPVVAKEVLLRLTVSPGKGVQEGVCKASKQLHPFIKFYTAIYVGQGIRTLQHILDICNMPVTLPF